MKNILLLTDFSENAQNAINYALELFKTGKHNFYMLNVQKTSKYTTGDLMTSSTSSTVYDSIIKNPKAKLAKMMEKLEQEYGIENYVFESICDYDNFISAVSQTVNLKNIDLIVMGTNGATGAEEVVFGSNTIKIIRNLDIPVLVIPQNYKYKTPKTLLFATDFDESYSEKLLKPLIYIINKFNTQLDILMLEKDEKSNSSTEKRTRMSDFFKGTERNFYTIGNVPSDIAIDSFVQIKEVDMTAKIINKESFLTRLISGSSADEITYKTRVPLLIIHP